jgi:hypothetical protein
VDVDAVDAILVDTLLQGKRISSGPLNVKPNACLERH